MVVTPVWVQETPLLSIAYLTAVVRSKGHEVTTFDFNIEVKDVEYRNAISPPNFEKKYMTFLYPDYFPVQELTEDEQKTFKKTVDYCDKWSERILNSNPDLICFSVYDMTSMISLMLARKIKDKDKNKLIIFGGPEAANFKNSQFFISTDFVDVVIYGEGEETLLGIVESVEKGGLNRTEGAILKKGNKIHDGGLAPLIKDLDTLPYPDFTDTPPNQYTLHDVLPAITSRGCVGNCIFCEERNYWRKYRRRSPENIVNELIRDRDVWGIRRFRLNDSLINGDMNNLSIICDTIVKKDLDAIWGGNARVDVRLNHRFLAKMYNAGCRFLLYGVESASSKILSGMNKGVSIEQIENALKDTYDMGILVRIYIISGFPTEDEDDVKETIEFIRRNKKYLHGVTLSRFSILRGSDLYKMLPQTGLRLYRMKVRYPEIIDYCRTYFTADDGEWYTKDGKSYYAFREERRKKIEDVIKDEGLDVKIPIGAL